MNRKFEAGVAAISTAYNKLSRMDEATLAIILQAIDEASAWLKRGEDGIASAEAD